MNLDSLGIDSENLGLEGNLPSFKQIDDTLSAMYANMVTFTDSNRNTVQRRHGLLITIFDKENIIHRTFIKREDGETFSAYFYNYAPNTLFMHIRRRLFPSDEIKSFIREITLYGEIVKETMMPNTWWETPILNPYSFSERNCRFYFSDKKELYIYGHIGGASAFYLAKYDTNMTLVYEKQWRPAGYYNRFMSKHLLVKDDCVYFQGDIEAVVGSVYSNKTAYVAKFREKQTSISTPFQLLSSQVYPNPTNELTTISLELETAGDVKIVLSDVLGQELLQIYDGFSPAGTFSKTFTTENLSRGVYFLKILSGKNFTVEKIVVN